MSTLSVWAVHLLTASGAALALGAALAAAHANWQLVFLCLGIALIVDGVDGTIARRINVKERVPWFDGAALDFVVDYATYVFVPAIVIADGGLLRDPVATITGIVVAVVGALYFADTRMKTADKGFRGFPAIWNTLAFLLMVYRPPEFVSVLAVAICAILTFAPIEFVHPVRVVRLRPLTWVMTGLWAVLAIVTVADDLMPGTAVLIGLGITSLYIGLIGIVLQLTRPGRSR
ncbi:MAG TPA: CDP-alcohol phosphatidyltransferase family protein [Bauldia sp.]|nr:CDP-alcohol phosphatidyltransferase family protein [Bauldia sp.]